MEQSTEKKAVDPIVEEQRLTRMQIARIVAEQQALQKKVSILGVIAVVLLVPSFCLAGYLMILHFRGFF